MPPHDPRVRVEIVGGHDTGVPSLGAKLSAELRGCGLVWLSVDAQHYAVHIRAPLPGDVAVLDILGDREGIAFERISIPSASGRLHDHDVSAV
jgi:hypothetical protein